MKTKTKNFDSKFKDNLQTLNQFLYNIQSILKKNQNMVYIKTPPKRQYQIIKQPIKIEQQIDHLLEDVRKLTMRQSNLEKSHNTLVHTFQQINDDQNKQDELLTKLDKMLQIQQNQEKNLNELKSFFRLTRH